MARSQASTAPTAPTFSPQVFEVTNLPIPAGTDWSTDPHQIGSLNHNAIQGCLYALYIELAEPVGDNGLEISVPFMGLGAALDGSADPSSKSALAQGVLTALSTSASSNYADRAEAVVIDTFGPTATDITVVRARAAFLFI